MLDIKWIRENPDYLDQALAKRFIDPCAAQILALDTKKRDLLSQLQALQENRKKITTKIGEALKANNSLQAEIHKAEIATIKQNMSELEANLSTIEQDLSNIIINLPNIPMSDVPIGKDESFNQEVHKFGKATEFSFAPKQHFELGENLGLMDFNKAGQISGARFVVLFGALARLERAIGQFMIDLHVKQHGYKEVSVPLLVRNEALYGTAQLPKFAEDLFKTCDDRWLIPTAEVPLTNLARETIFNEKDLPLRYTSLTPCFRSEAGSAGRDTRGMLRQHQFWKVELVSIATEKQAEEELEHMVSSAQRVLEILELPYRTMLLSSGDMGFSAQKTFDIEVWMPGQNCYREISSCSLCGSFQARRMDARYRTTDSAKPLYVNSLNGSGMAVGRCLIAIMENYQQEDGSIIVPNALVPYMDGLKIIPMN